MPVEAVEISGDVSPAPRIQRLPPARSRASSRPRQAAAATLVERSIAEPRKADPEETADSDPIAVDEVIEAESTTQVDVISVHDITKPVAPVHDGQTIDAPAIEERQLDEPSLSVELAATADVVSNKDLDEAASASSAILSLSGLEKRFGETVAVDGVTLEVARGSFYGIVGPNGAGKTTTLSMVTGLLRPDSGTVLVNGTDVWKDPSKAKRSIGVLPDRLRLFDRLTGAQFLYYAGSLRGLDSHTVRERAADLAAAFGLEDALHRLVADFSAGMTKKIALAAAMIHSPRLLVLDEPFESVDPVSAANVIDILQRYTGAGGTVVLSSHGMDMIQRVCDSVAIIVRGKVLASGTVDEVRDGQSLENRFVELAGGRKAAEGMEWLHSFSD